MNFSKFVWIPPFLQYTTERLLLIVAVSIIVKGKLTNETVNYDTKSKAYVPIWFKSVSYRKGSPGKRAGFKSSRSAMFFKIDVLKKFVNYTRITLCWSVFLKNLEAWRLSTLRGSRPEVFCEKDVIKNFAIFTGKHLCWSLFLVRLQALRPVTLVKRDSNTGVFLWILQKF